MLKKLGSPRLDRKRDIERERGDEMDTGEICDRYLVEIFFLVSRTACVHSHGADALWIFRRKSPAYLIKPTPIKLHQLVRICCRFYLGYFHIVYFIAFSNVDKSAKNPQQNPQ